MDIKEFAQEFLDNINVAVEMGNTDYDQELASAILEYLEDNGEVNNPEICSFQKTRARIINYIGSYIFMDYSKINTYTEEKCLLAEEIRTLLL